MSTPTRTLAILLAAAAPTVLVVTAPACGGNSDEPYKPEPAWSGKKANIPAPPTLPNLPIKAGSDFTVFGASHHLRSEIHNKDVTANPISVIGYIVDSNIPKAPDCAIHPSGKKDPDTCVDIPIPSFWVADNKGDKGNARIRVIGWARNFAIIYDAIKKYDTMKDPPKDPKDFVHDDVLNVDVPFPLPSVGAKVRLTGRYNVSGRNSGEMVSDPIYGVFSMQKIEYIEPAPDKAAFAKKVQ